MSSLENSLRVKSASVKGPAMSGPRPLMQPDVTAPEGQSGGIAKSKQVKNAMSTPNNGVDLSGKFAQGIGVKTSSDKTVGYF